LRFNSKGTSADNRFIKKPGENSMSERLYQIVYTGALLPQHTKEGAIANLAKLFKIDQDAARKIVSGGPCSLKKSIAKNRARKYASALMQAGLQCRILAMETGKPDASPSGQKPLSPGAKNEPESTIQNRPSAATGSPPPPRTSTGASKAKAIRIPIVFSGRGGEYFRIWIVNIILTILTLGIYSAWAKVRNKQYFYGNTSIDGAAFQYLAKPIQILKGRIIVAIFVITISVLSEFFPLAGGLLSLVMIIFLPWIVVRALAFNARNSSLRNIRFGFEARVWDAAKAFVLWPLAAVLTLGILTPVIYFKQKKFIVEHSRYGATKFQFAATIGDYYKIFFLLALHAIIGLIAVGLGFLAFAPLAVLLGLVLYLYLYAFITIQTSNLLYNRALLGPHRFQADMAVSSFTGIVLINSLGIVLTLGLFYPWAAVRALKYKLDHLALQAGGSIDDFLAVEEKKVSALGDEFSDYMDFDFGL
jgi:uncharacterized membrane protein YjgN (DUF898 family)